ncbi:putative phospholipase D precursor [Aspergillus leporis]|uniref:Putative phospholipase D n=1 Tax=Aspergillus leporis TaxID=41062 RepID=A0A5N5WYM9_9EURO|nr:putative phospholipase D precursor [Aspergillus leporis]
MSTLRTLVRAFYAVSLLTSATASPTTTQRPIYAIAHRVLSPEAVEAAISHGANALEVDLTAWHLGWSADHDPFSSSGSSAREIFETIAQQRRTGQNISFAWLHIKDPVICRESRACSVEALRDLAREILEPAGVRVLYGFYQTCESPGYRVVRESLNTNEGIILSGRTNDVLRWYQHTGEKIPVKQRVMDYGNPRLGKALSLYPELRYGSWVRDQGKLGKAFSWTSGARDPEFVAYLLRETAIDGFVYGHRTAEYGDEDCVRDAIRSIIEFAESHPDTHRMATNDDAPW